ncbi:MAG TPA: hypothetical protein VGK74_19630 [Symbiobacteriaceae bacterium]
MTKPSKMTPASGGPRRRTQAHEDHDEGEDWQQLAQEAGGVGNRKAGEVGARPLRTRVNRRPKCSLSMGAETAPTMVSVVMKAV